MSTVEASIEFRYAAPDDAETVRALVERAYRGLDNAGAWDSERHLLTGPRTTLAEVMQLISDPSSRIVTAWRAGRMIGSALIQRSGDTACSARSDAAYFGLFAIDPSARAGGLGKILLAECERRAASLWNSSAMSLTVISAREALIEWYERRGYRRTGSRLPFPFSDTSGETRRDFDLVELIKAL